MKHRVEIPPHVENQILDQALYIARDSVDRALTWAEETRSKIVALGEAPKAAPVDPEASDRAGHVVHRRASATTWSFISSMMTIMSW